MACNTLSLQTRNQIVLIQSRTMPRARAVRDASFYKRPGDGPRERVLPGLTGLDAIRAATASFDRCHHLRDAHQERLGDSSFPNFMISGSAQRLSARYSRACLDS